jgi:hypothetical protein
MRPIIFDPENICHILIGTKTMTRRVVEPQPDNLCEMVVINCPYISRCEIPLTKPLLWVLEKWCGRKDDPLNNPLRYKADYPDNYDEAMALDHAYGTYQWMPAMTMPYWASRIKLEITDLRAERLQEITEADAIQEGVSSIAEFKKLWDSINAIRGYGWEENPIVYAIEFKKTCLC